MHLHAPLAHGVNHRRYPLEVVHPREDVLLREESAPLGRVHALQVIRVLLPQRAQRLQPDVEDIELRVGQRGGDAAARRVPADDDVLDLEVEDGELDDGQQADVGGVDDVGDVAVREDVAGLAAEDDALGDSRVGAAQPEDRGSLAFGVGGKEVGIFLLNLGGPLFVGLERFVESVACGESR